MSLRTRSLPVRAALAVAALSLVAAAAPGLALEDPKGKPGPGFIKTDNVEHVMTLPLDTDSIGARVFGKDFYLRTAKGVTIYDTSNPLLPTPKGFVAVPATPNQERENIDTNGKILVTGQSIDGILYVIDVTNKTAPTIKSVLRGGADHTNTCILDCTYVYGSEGTIVDLRDPAAPKLVTPGWFASTQQPRNEGVSGSHDVTEVAPGLVATASNPVLWLDVKEPARPVVLARGNLPDRRYIHGVEWPNAGTDRFLLAGSETIDLACQNQVGTFTVWDTKPVRDGEPDEAAALENEQLTDTPSFTRTGQYSITKGVPTDMRGQFPASQHCGHWFTEHPDFQDGGLVAMAWYTYGVRFLEVTETGAVKERGFWQPLPGVSSAAFWVSKDVVWVSDYTGRGLDVLRFKADVPAQVDAAAPGRFVEAGSEAERQGAEIVNAAHAASHHTGTSVAELAEAWVCEPVGAPAPVGRPATLGGTLLATS